MEQQPSFDDEFEDIPEDLLTVCFLCCPCALAVCVCSRIVELIGLSRSRRPPPPKPRPRPSSARPQATTDRRRRNGRKRSQSRRTNSHFLILPDPLFAFASQAKDRTGDVCYKCNQTGHWASQCPSAPPPAAGPTTTSLDELAEKDCPNSCGLLNKRMSNTSKNPNRRFYSCNSCKFFEWHDDQPTGGQPAPPAAAAPKAQGSTDPAYDDVPEKQCPCGGGPCVVKTSNTPKNPNRRFYKCPAQCSFFEWYDQQSTTAAAPSAAGPSSSAAPAAGGAGDVCYKCNQTGHWASQCPQKPSYSAAPAAGAAGTTCYKCNQTGHWASQCPQNSKAGGGGGKGGGGGGACHKCGGTGHWARDCRAA